MHEGSHGQALLEPKEAPSCCCLAFLTPRSWRSPPRPAPRPSSSGESPQPRKSTQLTSESISPAEDSPGGRLQQTLAGAHGHNCFAFFSQSQGCNKLFEADNFVAIDEALYSQVTTLAETSGSATEFMLPVGPGQELSCWSYLQHARFSRLFVHFTHLDYIKKIINWVPLVDRLVFVKRHPGEDAEESILVLASLLCRDRTVKQAVKFLNWQYCTAKGLCFMWLGRGRSSQQVEQRLYCAIARSDYRSNQYLPVASYASFRCMRMSSAALLIDQNDRSLVEGGFIDQAELKLLREGVLRAEIQSFLSKGYSDKTSEQEDEVNLLFPESPDPSFLWHDDSPSKLNI